MLLETQNLCLEYPIYNFEKSLRRKFLNRENKNIKYISALKNINFKMEYGDRVGLIGNNGSGKTSFLKTLAGIYQPTSGNIILNQKPFCMFDTSMGLNQDATGRENIKIIIYVRGFKNINNQKIFDEIINFSELGHFIDLPVRTYSSGMKVRLATAICLWLKPKLLLIDEFFGAGDQHFRKKTQDAFNEKFRDISGFILASHEEALVNNLCNKIIKFENGTIVKEYKKN